MSLPHETRPGKYWPAIAECWIWLSLGFAAMRVAESQTAERLLQFVVGH
jgi:hypothetical protein